MGISVNSEDIESSILNQFFKVDISKPKAYSKATLWAKTLARLNKDQEALDKIEELSKDVILGENIHSLEELAISTPSTETIYLEIDDDKFEINVAQLYEELDKYYSKILTVVAIMYEKGGFSQEYMISSQDEAMNISSGHEYTENE